MPFNMIESLIDALQPLLLQRHNLSTKPAPEATPAVSADFLLTNFFRKGIIFLDDPPPPS
jgi:hypothetical protein